jgi:nitroreductase
VELDDAIRRRRMCRDFDGRPVAAGVVERLVERARWAPSAGATRGWRWRVLGAGEVATFWRHEDPDLAPPGVVRAPVILLPLASPLPYLRRYSQPDKAGMGRDRREGWPVPYWLVDASFAVMLLLLGAVEEGLGTLFFALHCDVDDLLADLGVEPGWQPLGAVAVGWPAGRPAVTASPGPEAPR